MKSSLCILVSPPASGKTYFLKSYIRSTPQSWVFVSPLRALANEVFLKMKNDMNCLLIKESSCWKQFKENKFKLVITTAELLVHKNNILNRSFIVIDEFHLFQTWGRDFRPILNELLMKISLEAHFCLGLTATLNEINLRELKEKWFLGFSEISVISYGSHLLKYHPKQTYFYPKIFSRLRLFKFLEMTLCVQNSCVLYFCKYRAEVKAYTQLFCDKGFQALGCCGGEVQAFSEALQEKDHIDIIFATTCLSHGVNLPKISLVVISYGIDDKDFWVQMVGRGGRKGEDYDLLYCCESGRPYKKLKLFLCFILRYWQLFIRSFFAN